MNFGALIGVVLALFAITGVLASFQQNGMAKQTSGQQVDYGGSEMGYIGSAYIDTDSVIWILVPIDENGFKGDGAFSIDPSDPAYARVREHLGVMKPGKLVPVRPWPNDLLAN